MTIESFISAVARNVKALNGEELAKLFDLNDKHIQDPTLIPFAPEKMKMGKQFVPWREMIACHLNVLTRLNNKDLKSALEEQFQLIEIFSELFEQIKDDNWFLPVMTVITVDLRCLAHAIDYGIDSQARHHSTAGENMKKATDCLMKLFRKCVSDSRTNLETSKKMGMMVLCNQLFKIFFTISQLNLCKPLILAIENLGLIDKFSISQQVTYNYYVGRKCMFDDNFQKANECLTFAFENCHQDYVKNKRLILIYLIPVKMLLGNFPSDRLLEKYNLKEFSGVVKSVKMGDLCNLDAELNSNGPFFISCGVYLILEKLKYIAYRNLFKTVYTMIGSHMIPIAAFSDALKFVGILDIDIDETECILANLIFENKIKGYLAHQQQKLVMSKTNAFPSINQTNVTLTR